MAYILDSVTLRNPMNLEEQNSTQFAQNRVLSGAVARDYFGANKRVWILDYTNTKKVDYDEIRVIYDSYLAIGTAKDWSVTEANYAVSATTVHVDLTQRSFNVGGIDYISDFTLVLTEN